MGVTLGHTLGATTVQKSLKPELHYHHIISDQIKIALVALIIHWFCFFDCTLRIYGLLLSELTGQLNLHKKLILQRTEVIYS